MHGRRVHKNEEKVKKYQEKKFFNFWELKQNTMENPYGWLKSGTLYMNRYYDNYIYSAQKKKLSAPEQGQNFPQMLVIQLFFIPVYYHQSSQ